MNAKRELIFVSIFMALGFTFNGLQGYFGVYRFPLSDIATFISSGTITIVLTRLIFKEPFFREEKEAKVKDDWNKNLKARVEEFRNKGIKNKENEER